MAEDDNTRSSQLRKKAERMLRQKGVQDPALYHKDLESLVEELSIHQIELEQQNEELKRIHNELEISRNRYSDLFDNAPVAYFIIQSDYRISTVNKKGGNLIGLDSQDLTRHTFTRFVHPDYQDTFYFHLRHILKTGESQSCELALISNGGERIFVSLDSTLVEEESSETVHQSIRSAITDITDRKEKEQISSRLGAIVNSSDDAIIGVDAQGKIYSWNPGAEKIYGYRAEEVIGHHPAFLDPSDPSGEIGHNLDYVLQGHTIRRLETVRVGKDGQQMNISLSVSPIYDDRQQVIGAAAIGRDITEQKKQQQQIRESEEKYRAIFENSGDGFLFMDRTILDCNRQAARMFGYSREELIGKNPGEDLSPGRQPDGEASKTAGTKYIKKALAGQPQQFYWKHKTKDGGLIDTEITLNAIDTRQGKRIIAIVHDISEQIDHQRELKEKNEEIQTQNEEYVTLNDELNEANSRLQETVEQLRMNEQRFRNYIESSPAAVILTDQDGRITYANSAALRLTGYGNDQLTQLAIGDIQEGGGHSDHAFRFEDLLEAGSLINRETTIIARQGQRKNVLVNATSLSSSQYLSFLTDITERKKAERALKRSEERFRSLYNNATDAIFIVDMAGRVLDANDIACQRLEYSCQNIRGLQPRDFTSSSYAEKFDERLSSIKQAGYASFETEHVSAQGEVIPVEINARVISYGETQAILKIARDITHRKRAEQEMDIKNRISNTFIKSDSERFYNDVLDIFREVFDSPYGFFGYIDDNGDLVSQSLTRDVWDQCQVPDKSLIFYRDSWAGVWGRVFKEKRARYQNGNLHPPKGHIRITAALACPVVLNGQLVGGLTLANKPGGYHERDRELITHLCDYLAPLLHSKFQESQYKQNLLEAKKKAEESDRLKSAFLANMSHEIRTPMNGIIGFTQLLKERQISQEKQQGFLKLIDDQSRQLLKIINDIIDISKIEANQLKIEKGGFYLNDLLSELYNSYSAQLEQEGDQQVHLDLALGLSRAESYIHSDRLRIRQILTNLISNALKFTSQGTIRFGYEKSSDNALQFFVSDTGQGIPEDKLKDIFDRFRQAEESPTSARHEGTGLGLSISKNLVHLLNGHISVESEEGKGSVFYFTLPYERMEEQQAGEERAHRENPTFDWSGHKILIVEDDPVSLEYLEEIIGETGASLLRAQQGREAFDKFMQTPDVEMILMDIQLPDRSGRQITKDIREDGYKIPIIAQTAYAMQEDKEKCLQAGCDDYISKPIDVQALLSIMNKYLENSR